MCIIVSHATVCFCMFLVGYPQRWASNPPLVDWHKLTYLVLTCRKTPINQSTWLISSLNIYHSNCLLITWLSGVRQNWIRMSLDYLAEMYSSHYFLYIFVLCIVLSTAFRLISIKSQALMTTHNGLCCRWYQFLVSQRTVPMPARKFFKLCRQSRLATTVGKCLHHLL